MPCEIGNENRPGVRLSREVLNERFLNGARPDQCDFRDLIASSINWRDDMTELDERIRRIVREEIESARGDGPSLQLETFELDVFFTDDWNDLDPSPSDRTDQLKSATYDYDSPGGREIIQFEVAIKRIVYRAYELERNASPDGGNIRVVEHGSGSVEEGTAGYQRVTTSNDWEDLIDPDIRSRIEEKHFSRLEIHPEIEVRSTTQRRINAYIIASDNSDLAFDFYARVEFLGIAVLG